MANKYSGHKVMTIFEDGTCEVLPVKSFGDDYIETGKSIIPRSEEHVSYYENETGNIYHIYNFTIPAAVEAENLKSLRRSVALKNILKYETGKKPLNIVSLMPWIIIMMLILFK